MTKSYGQSPINEFHYRNEDNPDDGNVKTAKKVSIAVLNKMVSEASGLSDETTKDSVFDMIEFTKIITRRRDSDKVKESKSKGCVCVCHGEDEQPPNDVMTQTTKGFVEETTQTTPSLIPQKMTQKDVNQAIKTILSEVKVCRCFQNYLKNHPIAPEKSKSLERVAENSPKEDENVVVEEEEEHKCPDGCVCSCHTQESESCTHECKMHCPKEHLLTSESHLMERQKNDENKLKAAMIEKKQEELKEAKENPKETPAGSKKVTKRESIIKRLSLMRKK